MKWFTCGLQVGFDAFGVDECEFAEGCFPALEDASFDEFAGGFALAGGFAGFLGAFACSFVLDVADGQWAARDFPDSVIGLFQAAVGDSR